MKHNPSNRFHLAANEADEMAVAANAVFEIAQQDSILIPYGSWPHKVGLQIFDRTGPGVDHPVYSNCLESRYLKVLWARVA
jgi:hypothetical protein